MSNLEVLLRSMSVFIERVRMNTDKFVTIFMGSSTKHVIKKIPSHIITEARSIYYEPNKYFELDENTKMLELDKLLLSRCRPDGVRNAVQKMKEAYSELRSKREPIAVIYLKEYQKYLVEDGNSTVTIAVAAGWPDIPVPINKY